MRRLFSFSGKPPGTLGVQNGRLSRCPSSPNCVCSDAAGRRHFIEPYRLMMPAEDTWLILREILSSTRGLRTITDAEQYIHAMHQSRIFGFIDDVEFHLRPADQVIALRSASRTGFFDLGANRRRLETIRNQLHRRGAVREAIPFTPDL